MSSNNSSEETTSFISKNKTLLTVAGAFVALVVVIIMIASYTISQRNAGERREQDLSALYNQSQISLSTCFDQGNVAAQVTEKEYESIKEILVGAASARYVDDNSTPARANDALGGGQLISALQENYPQVDQRSWQNLQTLVIGCRDEFQGTQNRIQSNAASYNKWRESENLANGWIKSSFPSDKLKIVTADGTTLYGQSAYDRIVKVVAVDEAINAFETGRLEEQDLFGSK